MQPPVTATARWGREKEGLWAGVRAGARPGVAVPSLDNFYAEYIMRNAGLEEAQAGIKIARRNINNFIYADDTTLLYARK